MIYATEYLAEVVGEIGPLLEAHYAEVAAPGRMNPDHDAYAGLAQNGVLRIYTARRNAELVGYATFILAASNLHNRGLKYASVDMLYVAPGSRGLTGTRLMRYAERELKGEGIQLISLVVPKKNDWMPLAERWGYEAEGTSMHKWIA